ncbi:F-box/kelch-repeat protein, partial [Cucurbita argyrosperma subsp. sororia]
MDVLGDSQSGRGVVNSQSMESEVVGEDNRVADQGSPLRGGGRNTSPLGRAGSRNTSPSRQKVIKTKPRGLDEETVTTFGKAAHPDVQMEDSIWAMLPEDLLNEILARVPPFLIFRFRSVCKRWNSILQDSSFLKFHAQVSSHGPCLLTFWKNSQTPQCSVFSLPLKTWYKIPFTFLPPWAFWLVGSSGGLVCFSGLDGLTFKTLVCNPLTQKWRALPNMHHNQQRQLILVVDRTHRSFKVVATSDIYGDKSLPTEVYDSRLNRWLLHQTMPAVNLCSSKMAYCDSKLYLEALSPLGLMMYRLDTGYWEHIPARFPRSLLDGYLVAGTQKRLFLVGRIGLYSTLQSMRIWELDHAKIMWVEISRMPPKYFRVLLRLSAERFECFGQDNLICFTSWNQGKSLLYDVDKKVWSWIAGCALQSCNSQFDFYMYTSMYIVLSISDYSGIHFFCCFAGLTTRSFSPGYLDGDQLHCSPTPGFFSVASCSNLDRGASRDSEQSDLSG